MSLAVTTLDCVACYPENHTECACAARCHDCQKAKGALTMKTPEAIAEDFAERWAKAPDTGEECSTVQDAIRLAIEADRAQRRIAFGALDKMLGDWADYDGDVTAFIQAWTDHFNDGEPVPAEMEA